MNVCLREMLRVFFFKTEFAFVLLLLSFVYLSTCLSIPPLKYN